jgi:fumarate hydratase class II
MKGTRKERDFLGEVEIPAGSYYGVETQRAVDNFRMSGLRFGREFIRGLGLIKKAAAETNVELGLLDPKLGIAIARASSEVADGEYDDQFVVDIFQSGSGTSTNMNANEVIANRANEILGTPLGQKGAVHPNDHVNMGQSSNDVIPTAIHMAALEMIERHLIPTMEVLRDSLAKKATEFADVVKTGRTHLQDATPITLGQEFGGYASQTEHGIRRVASSQVSLGELAIGGTAVGTGINARPSFGHDVVKRLRTATGLNLREAENHFEGQAAQDSLVEASGALKVVAVSLLKICNDLRLMSSGPATGLNEINLPAVQPGSSMMPGKVNPVIPEAVCQAAAQVIGNDLAVTIGGFNSSLDLNTMMPLMAHNLLTSISLLANSAQILAKKCIDGITANVDVCRRNAELSPALATRLNPIIGYEKATEIARESAKTGKTVREIVLERKLMAPDEAERILDPKKLTRHSEP